MGEAKRREEAGQEGPQKIYAEGDGCPACGKLLKDGEKEHGGKLLTISGAFVICWRCGNLFMPHSRIVHFEKAVGQKIIDPNSPVGQATQQAASKIVLPGV